MRHAESVVLPSNSTFDTSTYAYFTHTSNANLSFRTGGVNAARRKRRPPLQEYIRHLIFVDLSEQSIADVLKRLLRLPWAECEW